MRLKRLELFGFKSFADRTVLDYEGSLTGIVGPNGCGKSNVVDAVRWVLGETRPTSMRGGEMADVVFKGSVSRPAMSVAEVTMVLDNAAGAIEDRGSEVSISRRVFTSGEGEYLIDGERVRLKDLRNMLFDTGLGSRGYSVLEQGRIDAVLSANPIDRRSIFEEAAGISRYRQRKKEAESRLRRVEQDTARLDDVLRELSSRVRSLKIQAGKAERFVEARDEWRVSRSRLLQHRLFEHRGELARLAEEIGGLEGRVEELRAAREGGETDVQAREAEQLALAAEVDRLGQEIARLAGEGRACDERHAQLGARIEAWRASAEEESARSLEILSQIEKREAELEAIVIESRETETGLASAREEAAARQARLKESRREAAELRERSEGQNEAVLATLHEKTAVKNTIAHFDQARPQLAERSERAAARLAEGRETLAGVREEARASAERAEAARIQVTEAEEREATAVRSLSEIEREAEEARANRSRVELERARLASRIEALRDWEREREGLEAGARALIEGLESGEGPSDPSALSGLVADHLVTSTDLARALDAALGSEALGLVAKDPELAGKLVQWLHERGAGQVRLVLPGGLPPGFPPLPELDDLGEDRALVQGRLIDSVRYDAEYEPLARFLVGDVVVVRDLETARAVSSRHPHLRFVTPAGELVDGCGVLGGPREIAQGAVGRRASANELEGELEELGQELERLEATIARLTARRGEASDELERLRADLEARRAELSEAAGSERTASARLADLEATHALLEKEHEGVTAELARLDLELERSRERLAAIEADFETKNAELQSLTERRRETEAHLEELAREENTARVELSRVEAELAGKAERRGDLERVLVEARTELDRARRLAEESTASADRAQEEAAEVRVSADRLLEERGVVEKRLEELRSAEREGRAAIDTHRQRVDAVTRELEALGEALSEGRLAQQRVQMAREELATRAVEDLGRTEDDLLEGFQPEPELADRAALDALDVEVSKLKKKLDSLGPVNTEAMAELEEASTRFEFLDTQRKDLRESERSLVETLAKINEESVRLFVETFDEVRGHFQVLFRKLFGGGRADLVLAEGTDPLEAGIDIVARPPGREMLPIGLLSGGQRTMTALALLFAVFQSRPSPFCVLDEVDAALDDANIGRFLAMLDEFRKHTQFIVVTHNKGTMAACERLYGITMETKGVSTYVTVEFGEVDEFVPEATGNAQAADEARDEVAHAEPEPEPVEAQAPPVEPEPVAAAADGGAEDGEPVYELPRPGEVSVAAEAADPVPGAGPEATAEPESAHEPDSEPGEPEPEPAHDELEPAHDELEPEPGEPDSAQDEPEPEEAPEPVAVGRPEAGEGTDPA